MKNVLDFIPLAGFAGILGLSEIEQINPVLMTLGLILGLVLSGFRLYEVIKRALSDGKITESEAKEIIRNISEIKEQFPKK